jgi:hypothetical protein
VPENDMLPSDVLKSYLKDMPGGHIFDLPYDLFAAVFPPGHTDKGARESLTKLAEECQCDVKTIPDERRIELIKR